MFGDNKFGFGVKNSQGDSELQVPLQGLQFLIDPNDTEHSYIGSGVDGFSVVGNQRFSLIGGVTYLNPFFEFNGSDGYLQITSGQYANIQNALTFHVWTNIDASLSVLNPFIAPSIINAGDGCFYLYWDGTTSNLVLSGYNMSNVLTSYNLGNVLVGVSLENVCISVSQNFTTHTSIVYVNGVKFATVNDVEIKYPVGNYTRWIARVDRTYFTHNQGLTAMYNDLQEEEKVKQFYDATKINY